WSSDVCSSDLVFTELPAAVDDFLRTAFHFRIAALHGSEVEVGGIGAGGHRRGGTAAQTDQHARAAELDQQRALAELDLVRVLGADVAETAGDHDGLVIAAHLAVESLLQRAEITGQIGTAELVVEGSCAERAFDHDVERGGDAFRLAVLRLPGLFEAG